MSLEKELFSLMAWLLPLAVLSCAGAPGPENPPSAGEAVGAWLDTPREVDSQPLYRRIRAAVDSIRLIDTHEHLVSEKLWLAQKVDFFYWFQQPWFPQYAGSDLVSAGMPESDLAVLGDTSRSDQERWAAMAPYWPLVRFTAYCQALRIAARDIYGVAEIDESTWQMLNERIRAAQKPGFYEKVLSEKAGIDLRILDRIVLIDEDIERELPPHTVRVRRFDETFIAFDRATVEKYSQKYSRPVKNLDDWLALLDLKFKAILADGHYVGVKNAQAYDRPINFEDVPKAEAEKVFALLLQRGTLPFEARKPLEDFMMHQIAARAGRAGLPVQIHTGIQAGPGNDITRTNPTQLLPLIQKHPETRFDLFHGSYPYMNELGVLAKNYRNVYIDMCWLPVISPKDSRDWLEKWLETVPVNKILAFGGDYLFPEGTYAHSRIARRVVADALYDEVREGYMSETEALWTARRLLRDNATDLFDLQKFL